MWTRSSGRAASSESASWDVIAAEHTRPPGGSQLGGPRLGGLPHADVALGRAEEGLEVLFRGPRAARVLEQLLYKWKHSRKAVAPALAAQYRRLLDAGWELTEADVTRDLELLFGGAYEAFLAK